MLSNSTREQRERRRRLKIRLAALKRHAAARGPDGRSELAVAAGKKSGAQREGDAAWGLELALRRWHGDDDGSSEPQNEHLGKTRPPGPAGGAGKCDQPRGKSDGRAS